MKTISASKARKCFAEVLASVVKNGEPLVIVRYNEPVAALVPVDRLGTGPWAPKGRPRPGSGRPRS